MANRSLRPATSTDKPSVPFRPKQRPHFTDKKTRTAKDGTKSYAIRVNLAEMRFRRTFPKARLRDHYQVRLVEAHLSGHLFDPTRREYLSPADARALESRAREERTNTWRLLTEYVRAEEWEKNTVLAHRSAFAGFIATVAEDTDIYDKAGKAFYDLWETGEVTAEVSEALIRATPSVGDITEEVLAGVLDRWADKPDARTRARNVISGFMSYLVRRKHLTSSPMPVEARVKAGAAAPVEPHMVMDWKLLMDFARTFPTPVEQVMLVLMGVGGLRPSEAAGLRRGHIRPIDGGGYLVEVREQLHPDGARTPPKARTRNAPPRQVPIVHEPAAGLITALLASTADDKGPDDLLCPAPTGGRFDISGWAHKSNRGPFVKRRDEFFDATSPRWEGSADAMMAAALMGDYLTPHKLRHTACSVWLSTPGVDTKQVQEWGGWKDEATMLRYYHNILPGSRERSIDALRRLQ